VVVLAAAAGCGGDDREDVLDVMREARSALLEGDATAACRLLTAHGRERTLEFQVDFLPTGAPVPSRRRGVPRTCEQIFKAERRADPASWRPDVEEARFSVRSLDGDRASVRLEVPQDGPTVDFSLVKTDEGWRIDDSTGVPSGY
jgi:hypothetical protein